MSTSAFTAGWSPRGSPTSRRSSTPGLEEFPGVGELQLRAALPLLARRGVPLLVHAEIVADGAAPGPIRSYGDWVRVRPAEFESRAIALMLRLCREFRAAVHVVHLATGPETETFAAAQRAGLPFTAETCPHYLHFAADELADADVRYKCAPPIRGREDRQQLWQGLLGGAIRTIGSDHSPCPPVMKRTADGDWRQAWGGISSLQLTLPIVWTGAASRGATLANVAQWRATPPAELCGLPRKGRLAAGCDADLCVWDPDERWTIVGAELHHRHKLTPYDGQTVQGRVTRTYVRGQLAYDGGSFPAGPIGALLRRG